MSPERTEPTRDQLLAMAYVDAELDPAARAEVDRRMASEPELRREVVELRALALLARRMAPPEPMDHEWRELEEEILHTGGNRAGLVLTGVGVVGGTGWLLFELFRSELAPWPKLFAALILCGVLLLFLVTLRARLRTLPYDPYTKVER